MFWLASLFLFFSYARDRGVLLSLFGGFSSTSNQLEVDYSTAAVVE